MGLANLPREILDSVIYHLDSHADLYALSRICRNLYPSLAATNLPFHPNFRRDMYTLPRNHRFITNIVTQLADWAVESQSHSDELGKAICNGIDSLLILATEIAWVTVAEIRAAASAKDEIHELFLKIDEHEAAYGRPRIINGAGMRFGLSNPYDRALGYLIYCALFHHEVDAMLNHGTMPRDTPHLSGHLRLQYIEYCMPQKAYWRIFHTPPPPVHFDWHTCSHSQLSISERWLTLTSFFHTGTYDFKGYPSPRRLAETLETKPTIFRAVCLHLGWPSLCMLLPSGFKMYQEKLQAIRLQVMESDYEARFPQPRQGLDCVWNCFRDDLLRSGPLARESYDEVFGGLFFLR